jgi:hypothetical protein
MQVTMFDAAWQLTSGKWRPADWRSPGTKRLQGIPAKQRARRVNGAHLPPNSSGGFCLTGFGRRLHLVEAPGPHVVNVAVDGNIRGDQRMLPDSPHILPFDEMAGGVTAPTL